MIGLDQTATANLLRGLAQVSSRLDALTATVLSHAVEVRVEETNGATTTSTWWADATNRTRATAHRDVRLAVALGRFTALGEALAVGRVNTEQAHAIARALGDLESHGPADLEPVVVEQAEKHLVDCADSFDAKHLRVLGRHVLTVVAPEVGEAHEAKLLEDEERRAAERTRLTFASDGHGMVHGRFSIPTLHGAMLAKAIQALTWAKQDPAEVRQSKPTPVAAGQAFTELLERIDAKDLPSVGGVGATVVVTMTIDSLMGGLAAAALDTGEVISASTARRLACEAGVIRWCWAGSRRSSTSDAGAGSTPGPSGSPSPSATRPASSVAATPRRAGATSTTSSPGQKAAAPASRTDGSTARPTTRWSTTTRDPGGCARRPTSVRSVPPHRPRGILRPR